LGTGLPFKFHLSDFIDGTDKDDQEIEFDWGRYQKKLGVYIKELAVDRYRQAMIAREGRDNVLDYDFYPSHSPVSQ